MEKLGTVFIDRSSLRTLPQVVATSATMLREGHTVVAFPEATTWCGHAHGRMRPALFQAAIDAPCPVVPVRIEYRTSRGERSTAAAFVGRDTVASSVRNIVAGRIKSVHVSLNMPLQPGTDNLATRHDLATRAQHAVFGTTEERIH